MGQTATLMTKRRHTPEQVVRKLREADRLMSEGQGLPKLLYRAAARDPGALLRRPHWAETGSTEPDRR
jgi:hypothetical protein